MADFGSAQNGDGGQGVLGRLVMARDQARVDHGAAPALPRPQPATAPRAATHALARAVEGLYGLPVSPLDVTPAAITLAEMAELLPRPALLSVVEGAGEALGVVAICPSLMTALIEIQTLGRITARPVEPRRPTRSDAMICADFVNALLAGLGEEMAGIDGFEGFGGFRYASFMDDQRPLLLMLEDHPYRSLRFRLGLGQPPGREGEIFLALPQKRVSPALPAPTAPPQPAETPAGRAAGADGGDAVADPRIVLNMRAAPVDLVGVLCRRRIRLGALRNLQPGQILPLPRVDLSETRLETRLGQLLAIGKLGEAEGYHAVRLRGAGDEVARDGPEISAVPAEHGGRAAPETGDGAIPGDMIAEPPMGDMDRPDGFRPPRAGAGSDRPAPDLPTPRQKSA